MRALFLLLAVFGAVLAGEPPAKGPASNEPAPVEKSSEIGDWEAEKKRMLEKEAAADRQKAAREAEAARRASARQVPPEMLRQAEAINTAGIPDTEPQPIETLQASHDSLHILDMAVMGNHLWLITSQGSILHSSTQGNSWERQAPARSVETGPGAVRLRRIQFLDTNRGFISGSRGTFLSTRDGGRTWEARRVGLGPVDFPVLLFLDSLRGLLVDHQGRAMATRDGGDTWARSQGDLQEYTAAMAGQGKALGWCFLAGPGGKVGISKGWAGISSPVRVPGAPDLRAIHFLDSVNGFVGGRNGILARTRDGGFTWDTLSLRSDGKVLDLAFLDPEQGFAVGEKGLLFETRNAGVTWLRASRNPSEADRGSYLRFPPPIYFVLLALVALLVVPVLRSPRVEVVQESIADQLVSDRPLEDDRFDVLGLCAKADALAAFLSNPRTEPPLTFGIMGEWGKGKSSLMNLLRNRLGRDGFTTVWFNAWHHQSEESLLASLLETIRRTRIAPWWTLDGMRFRLSLGLKRMVHGRETDWLLLLTSLVVFLVLWRWNPLDLQWSLAAVEAFFNRIGTGNWGQQLKGLGGVLVSLLPLGVSVLSFWRIARKALVVFDAQPGRLIADMAGRATLRDMSEKIGFREEFRREFFEVAEALRHAPLVVFIDDLDRCHPDKVMEILESINFLVTCGPCYFVVAMDKRQITRAIIVNDEKVIELFKDHGESHAQEYLEKIINIEVPVPEPGPDSYKRLMTMGETPLRPARPFADRRWQEALKNLPIFLVLGFLFYLSGALLRAPSPDTPAVLASTDTGSAARSDSATYPDLLTGEGLEAALPFSWDTVDPPMFQSGNQAPWTRPFAVAIPALFGTLLVWVALSWYFQRRRRFFRDSPDFVKAVDDWHPLIFLGAKTPRSVKKFLNRLRFFAVLKRNAPPGSESMANLGDGDLVALASVELGMKSLLEGAAITPENLKRFEGYLRQVQAGKGLPDRVQTLANREDMAALLKDFGTLGANVRMNN